MTEQVEQGMDLVFPDEMSEVTFKTINGLIEQRNAQVARINAVKGDRQTLSEQLTEASTVPEAVAARAARDQAQEALDEAIMALHAAVQSEIKEVLEDAEGTVTEIEKSIQDLDGKIKPATNFFKKMYGEALAKNLVSLERLKGFTTRGAGATGRRVRGYDAAVTLDEEVTGFENLASAAKFLGVETTVLQEAFFAAAGNPTKLKDAPDRVDFEVTFTEVYEDDSSDIKVAHITATRATKDEVESEDETEDESDVKDDASVVEVDFSGSV